MPNKEILKLLSGWTEEINSTILNNRSLYIALFSVDKKLLFANNSMSSIITENPDKSFINPTFDRLLELDNSVPLIFEGFLTIGNSLTVDNSIWTQVYRKKDLLLLVGGVDATQLVEQNDTMHNLNHKISNLQRDLIREKNVLEKTLKELNNANTELQELNTSKDRFFSILAHDLKNPFSSLLGFSSILKKNVRKYDITRIEKQVTIINEAASQTYSLLEDLLLWSRAQSGKLTVYPDLYNLHEESKSVVEGINNQALSKNIIINNIIPVNITAFTDINLLKTVMRNLISNAIKFTPKGGKITINAEILKNEIIVSVTDTGVGIKEELLSELFNIASSTTTRGTENETGTGFGLQICKEFVEKMSGKIWVESEEGKGSVFYFTIPNQKI